MGDLKRKNKFDKTVEELDEKEDQSIEKTSEVVKTITGKKEKKKTLPVYMSMNLYKQFDQINKAYGLSNNAAINMLIRDYVIEKSKVIE